MTTPIQHDDSYSQDDLIHRTTLKVWKESHRLALLVYHATPGFPAEEVYGLTSQMRQSAVSIPANLAGGCSRGSDRDFARFIRMSQGSAAELEYYAISAGALGYLTPSAQLELGKGIAEVKAMLTGLVRAIAAAPGQKPR